MHVGKRLIDEGQRDFVGIGSSPRTAPLLAFAKGCSILGTDEVRSSPICPVYDTGPFYRGTMLIVTAEHAPRYGMPSRHRPCSLTLCTSVLICVLAGCGGKNATVSTPPPPAPTPLATASFTRTGTSIGSFEVTLPLAQAQQITSLPAPSHGIPAAACTLQAGNAPMVFTAGSSSTWFGVTPQFGNLQPNGTTSIQISTIIWSNVATGGQNNGFVIVSASGYNQLTGMNFFIRNAGTDSRGNPLVRIGYSCP